MEELEHDVGTMDTAAAGQPSPKRRSNCETSLRSAGWREGIGTRITRCPIYLIPDVMKAYIPVLSDQA